MRLDRRRRELRLRVGEEITAFAVEVLVDFAVVDRLLTDGTVQHGNLSRPSVRCYRYATRLASSCLASPISELKGGGMSSSYEISVGRL